MIREYGGQIKETYGVPVSEIVEGIKNGVRKINIDTDIRLAMTATIRKEMAHHPAEFDPRAFLKAATIAARSVCKSRFEAFGSAGQAAKIKVISLENMAARYAKGELAAIVK
jgi:fructose-bisphosphate aldolase class II